MGGLHFILVTSLMVFPLAILGSKMCSTVGNFGNVEQNQIISGSIFIVLTDVGLVECAKQCILRTKCASINYDEVNSICDLNMHNSTIGTIESVIGELYSDISTWPKTLSGICENHSCPPNSFCLDNGGVTYCETECPDPELVNGDIISFESRQVGSDVYYECDFGFTGSDSAVCGSNGTWVNLTCARGCTDPPTILDAVGDVINTTYAVGVILNYTCTGVKYSVGEIKCRHDLNWTDMVCIDGVRNCSDLQNCGYNADDEYWLLPEAFGDKTLRVYCYGMDTVTPRPYITLPEETYVDYSEVECNMSSVLDDCNTTRQNKIAIAQLSNMNMTWNQVRDRTFVNRSSTCYHEQFGSVYDCHETCNSTGTRRFVIDTRGTGIKLSPDQQFGHQQEVNWAEPLTITKTDQGRVIVGECHQHCGWCYPIDNVFTFVYDHHFIPDHTTATIPNCPGP